MFSIGKTIAKAVAAGVGGGAAATVASAVTGDTVGSVTLEEAVMVIVTALASAAIAGVKNWLKNRKK